MNNNGSKNVNWVQVIALTSVVLSLVTARATAQVVLIPGKIDGTVTLGAEVIASMNMRAYSSVDNATLSLNPNVAAAPYSLTVNVPSGTTPTYTVQARDVRTQDSGPLNYDYLSFPNQTVVAEESTTKTVDFTLASPGYVEGIVNLAGSGQLNYVVVQAFPNPSNGYSHYTRQNADAVDRSTLSYQFPVSSGDMRCQGTAYLTSGTRITLPIQNVTVSAGGTVSCNYDIDTPATGEIAGQISFPGAQTPNRFGVSTSGPTSKSWVENSPADPEAYSLPDLSVGTYSVYAYANLNNNDDYFSFPYPSSYLPSQSTVIEPGDIDTINVSACQAYVDGTISLLGSANMDDVSQGLYYASGVYQTDSYRGSAYDRIDAGTGDYDLVLSEGDWISSLLRLYFSRPATHPDGYLNTRVDLSDRSVMYTSNPASLACGTTESRNHEYRMGQVTVNFSIATGGVMSSPQLRFGNCSYLDDETSSLLYSYNFYASSNQSNVEVGSVTFVAPQADCTRVEALAVVDGTTTTFGTFPLEVVGGVDVVIDIGGPVVSVTSPDANFCVAGDSLTVTGTATDDVGVVSVAVNGVDAALSPAGGEGTLSTDFSATISLAKGANTVETIATDTSGKTGSDTRTVYNDAGPPVLSWTPTNGTVTQSSTITVAGTVSDDSDVESVTVNGDPVVLESTDTSGEYSFSTTVTLEPGDNNITVVAADTGGCADDVVEVHKVTLSENTAPSVTEVSVLSSRISVDGDIEASCIFTDPDASDTHTVDWDWGDDAITAGDVDGLSATGSHNYSEPGRYSISCEVTDSYGESDEGQVAGYIVVYDPNGGFVTGGGRIDSPEGAYSYNGSLGGKSNYGIVAKYKKGGGTPMGSTEFQFHAGRMNFHSTDYDWFIVTGDRAQYLGSGTINREAGYQFMVTVVDGGKNGGTDAFRIKIWDESDPDNPVYDSQPGDSDDADPITPIGKGSIVIHKAKSK
jgi:hypothetical protein